jgi:hypothetical protein
MIEPTPRRTVSATLRTVLLGLLTAAAVCPSPAQAKLSAADKQAVAQLAVEWAVNGGISDYKLVKNPADVIVADFNLPKGTHLQLPGRRVTLYSLLLIQALADRNGDFLYFRFNHFTGDAQHATVAIALVWAISAKSRTPYLSGGGATLEFEKHDGKWKMLPVTNRWMS